MYTSMFCDNFHTQCIDTSMSVFKQHISTHTCMANSFPGTSFLVLCYTTDHQHIVIVTLTNLLFNLTPIQELSNAGYHGSEIAPEFDQEYVCTISMHGVAS